MPPQVHRLLHAAGGSCEVEDQGGRTQIVRPPAQTANQLRDEFKILLHAATPPAVERGPSESVHRIKGLIGDEPGISKLVNGQLRTDASPKAMFALPRRESIERLARSIEVPLVWAHCD
jgi:hypothetical protein